MPLPLSSRHLAVTKTLDGSMGVRVCFVEGTLVRVVQRENKGKPPCGGSRLLSKP